MVVVVISRKMQEMCAKKRVPRCDKILNLELRSESQEPGKKSVKAVSTCSPTRYHLGSTFHHQPSTTIALDHLHFLGHGTTTPEFLQRILKSPARRGPFLSVPLQDQT